MGSRNEVSAGGVVYRREEDAIEIALAARRTRRGDLAWGLAKGAIEPGETEEQAAVREVLEETGVKVELVGERREDVEDPVQLRRPAGVQLENIGPGHQHIDLIYFARPRDSAEIHADYSEDKVGWYGPEDWEDMQVNTEVTGWCERALSTLDHL